MFIAINSTNIPLLGKGQKTSLLLIKCLSFRGTDRQLSQIYQHKDLDLKFWQTKRSREIWRREIGPLCCWKTSRKTEKSKNKKEIGNTNKCKLAVIPVTCRWNNVLQPIFFGAIFKVFGELINNNVLPVASSLWPWIYFKERRNFAYRTEVNKRDLDGLVLQTKCESQAFLFLLPLFIQ